MDARPATSMYSANIPMVSAKMVGLISAASFPTVMLRSLRSADVAGPLPESPANSIDGAHRHECPRSAAEIRASSSRSGSNALQPVFAHHVLDGQHAARGEDPRGQPAKQIVQGGSSNSRMPGGTSMPLNRMSAVVPRPDQYVCWNRRQRGGDVVVTAEVHRNLYLSFVVQRRFGAHPFPHRVRIVVDGMVERVVAGPPPPGPSSRLIPVRRGTVVPWARGHIAAELGSQVEGTNTAP